MSELKCPFCGKFLDAVVKNQNDWIYSCGNPSCEFFDDCDNYEKKHYLATPEFWQELIRTRKALEIAVDGIKYMRNNCLEYAADYMDKADDILEQITALEQKDK
ncbi:MAG: hypothetical protein J6W29_03435 [Neisseriaceae bacterium]|nr:hypothetical protein [Neisseriaceae bacterium]